MKPSERKHILRYGGESISYVVTVNSRRNQRIKIDVRHNGLVEVEAPSDASTEAIAKAVAKRARWIVSHAEHARKRFEHVLPREYVSGEQVIYLGRRYVLKVWQVPRPKRSVKLKGAYLVVAHDQTEREPIRARVRAWYKIKARAYFADRIGVVAQTLPWQQEMPLFGLKEMKTRWGACATGGTITLNPFLVRAPRECIDYVITHELCHLREHNHSPEFFRLLSTAMPQWQMIKTRLDGMAEVFLND